MNPAAFHRRTMLGWNSPEAKNNGWRGISESNDTFDDDDQNFSDEDDENISAAMLTSRILIVAFWGLILFANFYYLWIVLTYRRRRGDRHLQDNETDEDPTDPHAIAKKLADMATDDKIEYFDKLFDKQGNQTRLSSDQIIVVAAVSTDVDRENKGQSSDKVTNGDIETGPIGDATVLQEHPGIDDAEEDSAMTYLSLATIRPCSDPDGDDGTRTRKIHGQCAICLENYQTGDTVVYNINACGGDKTMNSRTDIAGVSSDQEQPPERSSDCSHVYHKACFVQYLANRKVSKTGLRDGEADVLSCPTCRQPFCELLPIASVVGDGSDASLTEIDSGEESSEAMSNAESN
jgi:hypothetical protein